jgi:hypothetical protein
MHGIIALHISIVFLYYYVYMITRKQRQLLFKCIFLTNAILKIANLFIASKSLLLLLFIAETLLWP